MARLAAAGQYRKQYYRRGVLEHLFEKGNLPAALAALPPRRHRPCSRK